MYIKKQSNDEHSGGRAMNRVYKLSLKGCAPKIKEFLKETPQWTLQAPELSPHAFLVEVKQPEDLSTVCRLKKQYKRAEIIVFSPLCHNPLMRRALDRGAFYALEAPIRKKEFLFLLKKLEDWWLFQQTNTLWVGNSLASQRIKKEICLLKNEPGPLLIEGESGTGKDIVAQLLSSPDRPFVCVNMASLPENLFESQMFGHEKGAFTGAHHHHKGFIESAKNGDLFLDEIEALSLSSQAKLLRFLENQEIQILGKATTKKIHCRVIVATNESLEEKVRRKEFREDLLWRLKSKVLHLPPLRQRKEDILPLIKFFISQDKAERKKTLTPQALLCLKEYAWPGNIRELKKVTENLLCRCALPLIEKQDVEPFLCSYAPSAPKIEGLSLMLKEYEKDIITKCLHEHKSVTKTQKILGLSRSALYKKIKSYSIDY